MIGTQNYWINILGHCPWEADAEKEVCAQEVYRVSREWSWEKYM